MTPPQIYAKFDAYTRFLQDCEGMDKTTLKAVAKSWRFTGYSRYTHSELLDMLRDKAKFELKCIGNLPSREPGKRLVVDVQKENYNAPYTHYTCKRLRITLEDGTEYVWDMGCDPSAKPAPWMRVGGQY